MKYRVRLDLFFDSEADARAMTDYAKSMAQRAQSIKEGSPDEEIAFCDLEICRHDDPEPSGCTRLERLEIRSKQVE